MSVGTVFAIAAVIFIPKEWELKPVLSVGSFPIGALVAVILVFLWTSERTPSRQRDEARALASRPPLVVKVRETRCSDVVEDGPGYMRATKYLEVLTTFIPSRPIQIGDIDLDVCFARLPVVEKPVNTLELIESHWLRFALPDNMRGVIDEAAITVLVEGGLWESSTFVFNTNDDTVYK